MRLTAYTDYSLRTLMYLATNDRARATIADIAAANDISLNHLTKVVHQLGVHGDVETVRGRHGGLRLGRPAAEINIGAVVRRTEPDMQLVPCFGGTCVISPECVLQHALEAALQAFLAVLDGYTLADLAAPGQRLAALFGIADIAA